MPIVAKSVKANRAREPGFTAIKKPAERAGGGIRCASARRHEAVRKMLAQRSLMQFCLLLMVIFSTSEIASVIAGI